ncbi:hypothetical protein CPB85DRAFT_216627 [Mucidula mucida]|nr:hypothetical protein CPB85DRAFT_216627 [Mucidula mucida]
MCCAHADTVGSPRSSSLKSSQPSLSTSPTSDLYTVSIEEAISYYWGVSPTPPKLVYRSSSTKRPYARPKGWRKFKEARGVFGHKLNAAWKDVGPQVRDLLNTHQMYWTSIDVVRFIADGENEYKKIHGPVVIWIGVFSGSLQGEDAFRASNEILDLLKGFDIVDVEVEFRESIYRRSAGPALLKSVYDSNPTVGVRRPLSHVLGLSIATADRPTAQGNMALYFAEGGDSDKILGLTCHHVLFETDEECVLEGDTSRRHVQLLGTDAFNDLLASIKICIGSHASSLEDDEEQIQLLEAKVVAGAGESVAKKLDKTRDGLDKTNRAIADLEKFYEKVQEEWSEPGCRIIGHIRFSPAVTVDDGGFAEDWSALELDNSKFKDAFQGNVLDIRTDRLSLINWVEKMQRRTGSQAGFDYPLDDNLPLRDTMTLERMQSPGIVDRAGETCIFVIKNGQASGVTIGRATGLFSFVRSGNTGLGSMAWAIYNYGCDNGHVDAFSKPGDSGSVIVGALGVCLLVVRRLWRLRMLRRCGGFGLALSNSFRMRIFVQLLAFISGSYSY